MPRVLVVDDSPTELHLMAAPLRRAGYDVYEARDGDEALNQIHHTAPDVVLLDVIMPGKNGFQLCRQIKNDQRFARTPVIIVTSKGQESDRFWGLRQGASEYIVKPFTPQQIVAAVRRHTFGL